MLLMGLLSVKTCTKCCCNFTGTFTELLGTHQKRPSRYEVKIKPKLLTYTDGIISAIGTLVSYQWMLTVTLSCLPYSIDNRYASVFKT